MLNLIKKELTLSYRHMFTILMVVFSMLAALSLLGIDKIYSNAPNLVMLDIDDREFPNVTVIKVSTEKAMKDRVRDVDVAIGVIGSKMVVDGRESKVDIQTVEGWLNGKEPNVTTNLPVEMKNKLFTLPFYQFFQIAGLILLFKLVDERQNRTLFLNHVSPISSKKLIAAKIVVSLLIMIGTYLFCAVLLDMPLPIIEIFVILLLGSCVGLVLGFGLAFIAKNESQALGYLKPITLIFVTALPILGFFMEQGIAQEIAMISPFYWLLQMVYYTLGGDVHFWFYAGLTAFFSVIAFAIIIVNWSKTSYSRPSTV